MKVRTIADTQRCPACLKWIPLPRTRRRAALDRHIRACAPDVYARQRARVRELLGEEA